MIPKTIRILGKTYEVVKKGSEVWDEDKFGQCDDAGQKIYLRGGLGGDMERDTLLHEILHAIDFHEKAGLKERQVETMAAGFYAVLRENPDFAKYLIAQAE